MSGQIMTFPGSVEEFMESYKMVDTEHIYSNGTEYVPIYRMKQWFEHLDNAKALERKHGEWLETSESIDVLEELLNKIEKLEKQIADMRGEKDGV